MIVVKSAALSEAPPIRPVSYTHLVNDYVTVRLAKTKGDIYYTPDVIMEEYGVTPKQMIDCLLYTSFESSAFSLYPEPAQEATALRPRTVLYPQWSSHRAPRFLRASKNQQA